MPLVDAFGKTLGAQCVGRFGRPDRVIADLGTAFFVLVDPMAELPGEELRAKAQAEIGLVLFQCEADEIDLAPDEIVLVIGAHRSAADDDARMTVKPIGQGIAHAGTTDIKPVAARGQQPPDAPGR